MTRLEEVLKGSRSPEVEIPAEFLQRVRVAAEVRRGKMVHPEFVWAITATLEEARKERADFEARYEQAIDYVDTNIWFAPNRVAPYCPRYFVTITNPSDKILKDARTSLVIC